MTMDSDCGRAKELMSGAVDCELSTDESSYFDRHIQRCELCRNEFELERLTRIYFRERVGLLEPPDDLLDSIRERLSEEDRLSATRINEKHAPRIRFRRYLWPELAIAAVLIVAIVTVFNSLHYKTAFEFSHRSPAVSNSQTNDALDFSENDFQNVVNGKFNPDFKSHETSDIIKFLKANAGYSIPLPVIRSAEWIGGSVGTLEAKKVVDVVYKVGSSYLFIHAFPTSLAHSGAVSLSRECTKALDQNKWFWKQTSSGHTQVTWKDRNHVCVATSNLDKSELVASLKSIEGIEKGDWQ